MEIAKGKHEVSDDLEIVDLCLYIKSFDTLVIGDAHMGYEESLTRAGILLPKFQFEEIMERLQKILKMTKPERVIVVGDLKHEFGRISKEEWRDTLDFIDLLKEESELILIKGNHDTILEPITDKRELEVHEHYSMGEYYFCHGHKKPTDLEYQNAETVIMGHEHPAVGLVDGPRKETFKCFLKGPYDGKTVIVLPSLSSLPEGTDVLKERIQSPLLEDLEKFTAYVVEDKVYEFGKIKDLKE